MSQEKVVTTSTAVKTTTVVESSTAQSKSLGLSSQKATTVVKNQDLVNKDASPQTLLQQPKDLISCDVNMSQLTAYMNTMIQVINQHAKLLDAVSYELGLRPLKKEIGEMFNVLAHTYPFE